MGLSRPVLAALVLAAAAPGARASAQTAPTLHGVHVRVEHGELTRIVARFELRSAGDTLVFTAVPWFGLDITDLEVLADGRPLTGVLRAPGRAIEVRVPLPPDAASLEVRYDVPAAAAVDGERHDLRVPLLLPRAAASGSADDFFRVELVASGMYVVESFPTVPDAGSSGVVTHTMTLPVAPGLLRWRLTTGAAPRVGFAGAVDIGVFTLLALLGIFGIIGLRRTAEAP